MARRTTIAALLALSAGLAPAAGPGGGPGPAGGPAMSLTVRLAVPEHRGRRTIRVDGPDARFHVVLENAGDAPLRLWAEGCSWGYAALAVELVDEGGRRSVARKAPVHWKQDAPDFITLGPGEAVVREVALGSPRWEGAPLPPPGASRPLTARALFYVPDDEQARRHGVWTGSIASGPMACVVERRGPDAGGDPARP